MVVNYWGITWVTGSAIIKIFVRTYGGCNYKSTINTFLEDCGLTEEVVFKQIVLAKNIKVLITIDPKRVELSQ